MQPLDDPHARNGQLIGANYVLGEVIGIGGMGVVYSATQRTLGRLVAVKVPRPDLTARDFVHARFRNEAIAGSRLTHRNLVTVIDFGEDAGAPFLVTECVRGTLLGRLVNEYGPPPLSVIASVTEQILDALAECHAAGVVHADVKCDNILIQTMRDGSEVPRLIDFGLARFLDDGHPAGGERVLSGTPEYLAPEVIRGEAPTIQTDIYAVGVMLYELLTGTTPFAGGTCREILSRHLDDDVVPPSLRRPDRNIPGAFERIVMRALHKVPEERFADAAACSGALHAAAAGSPPPAEVSRGTPTIAFSTESPTRNWDREELTPPPRLAVGSSCGDSRLVQKARATVAAARLSKGIDSIICSYLDLARALVDDHRLAEAAAELETCVTLFTTESPASSPAPLWRVLLTLAALYSGLGDTERARRSALAGHDQAERSRSTVGRERARALLARFSRGGAPRERTPPLA